MAARGAAGRTIPTRRNHIHCGAARDCWIDVVVWVGCRGGGGGVDLDDRALLVRVGRQVVLAQDLIGPDGLALPDLWQQGSWQGGVPLSSQLGDSGKTGHGNGRSRGV